MPVNFKYYYRGDSVHKVEIERQTEHFVWVKMDPHMAHHRDAGKRPKRSKMGVFYDTRIEAYDHMLDNAKHEVKTASYSLKTAEAHLKHVMAIRQNKAKEN